MKQTNIMSAYQEFCDAYYNGNFQGTMDLSEMLNPNEMGLMDVHRVKAAREMLQAERQLDTRRVIQ